PFDRIWESDLVKKANYLVDVAAGTKRASTDLPIDTGKDEQPPQKVMQTVVVGRNGNLTYRMNLDGFPKSDWAYSYFAEIEDLGPTKTRKFRLVLPGEPELSKAVVNIQENAQGTHRLYEPGFEIITLPFFLSFKFRKTSDSSEGPLVNAIKINKYLKISVGSLDGKCGLAGLAQEGGDPCLPVAWSWLECNLDREPKIISVKLSGKNLTGSNPSDFASEASFRHVQGTTSRDLWLSLKKAYAPHSTSREYTLKTQLLRILMHGDKNPDAYLNRAQEYADALAAIGEPVKDEDLVMLVVSGLHEEYNGLKTTITARQSPTAFRELHALLSDHDYMLGKTRTPIASYGPQAFYGARPSNNNRMYGTCNRCGIGHIPSQCPNRDPSTIRTRPSANFANTRAQSSNASTNWYSHIRATSHVTPDLEAMDNSEAYYGDDALHVGNGKGLPILHIGSSKVYSPQKAFSLKNILYVPEISHNLLSVQIFCHDNDGFFEFHTSYFVVKDESTHTTLLTGPSKHGLYTITLS
ncbi:probable LRR receptor-like serine/threonine-protein kinase, partial [Tanacetum coccineum]